MNAVLPHGRQADPRAIGPEAVHVIISGEPASKANSRIPVPAISREGKPFIRFIKSEKAQLWLKHAAPQVPVRHPLLTGRLIMWCRIYYASERPDLDESLVLDFLQGRVYENDRQVRERHVYHLIDRRNPRVHCILREVQPCMV